MERWFTVRVELCFEECPVSALCGKEGLQAIGNRTQGIPAWNAIGCFIAISPVWANKLQ